MSGSINERIIKLINDKSAEDSEINKFLIDLLLMEASHAGSWWYKDYYKKSIQKYAEDWSLNYED